MVFVSQPLQWSFSNITNNCEGHVASRKRAYDAVNEGAKQTRMDARCSNKKPKVVESVESVPDALYTSDASDDSREIHEFLAGDWRFDPRPTSTESRLEEDQAIAELVNVEKVISILFEALKTQNKFENENESKDKHRNQNQNQNKPPVYSYYRRLTSPLSGSPDRVPLVRKAVGGSCGGKVDPGLQKWVLCKNHYNDICAYHPSYRSAEWIEALHEMGWEDLHPTYISQYQQTFQTLAVFSSCEDWIDIGDAEEVRRYGTREMKGELQAGHGWNM